MPETRIVLKKGDITQETVDAIVNAANSGLMGGGGVDGAIHKAAGFELKQECRKVRMTRGYCLPGNAVITKAGRLKAKFVIHAVGPVWQGGGQQEDQVLKSAYLEALTLAVENGVKTIAFPSISTGAFSFPVPRAANIALGTVITFLKSHPEIREVRFILFSDEDFESYTKVFEKLNTPPSR